MQNRGGADLDIAAADCQHFKDASKLIELPKKFWLVFNVPGFYHITEYDVDRVSYSKGLLDKMWGSSEHDKAVAHSVDIGRLVFFTEEEAKAGMQKLIEENNREDDKICESWRRGFTGCYCNGTKEQEPCTCGGDRSKCDFYESVRKKALEDA
jgi:hypothetical protein